VSNKRAQAQALSDQIDALGRKESALAEQYNAAVLAAQSTATKVNQQQAAVAAAESNANKAKTAIQSDAVNAYVHGGTLASLASRNGGVTAQADGGLLAGEYMSTLASTQSDNLDAFHSAASTARIAATQLQALQKQQAKAAATTNAARSATIAAQQKVQSSLGQVKGELTTLVAQAEAAKQAAEARAAQALLARVQTSSGGGGGAGGASFASIPVPVGVGAGAAVAAAESRLGSPYVWGAAGPGAFDCSGLVMWAWGHAGVSLPHFSGAQYSSTTHISMSQLQPGDLVFPSNPGSHVAMYIGGGQIIEAPHTGAVVHIVPLSSWFVLASRP
jgi:cell wall-associated NlpC family hydrolase